MQKGGKGREEEHSFLPRERERERERDESAMATMNA